MTTIRAEATKRNWRQAIWRGFRMHCPNCDAKTLFRKYLKVADSCSNCGEELHHHQADDAPPYFTIFIIGHIIIPAVLCVEILYHPQIWIHMVIWLPLTVALTLIILPMTKGAVIALQWAMRMHGFEHATKNRPPTQS